MEYDAAMAEIGRLKLELRACQQENSTLKMHISSSANTDLEKCIASLKKNNTKLTAQTRKYKVRIDDFVVANEDLNAQILEYDHVFKELRRLSAKNEEILNLS